MIVRSPSGGSLQLNGTNVAAGQSIPQAQLTTLVFTPTAGSFGSPYATFQFSVSDGTATSGTATQTINVVPVGPATREGRSGERRVGDESIYRWEPYHSKTHKEIAGLQ